MNILLAFASVATFLITSIAIPTNSFAFTFDQNVPAAVQTQMTKDLGFIHTIQGNNQSDLHKQIFGAVNGDSYSDFFTKRVTAVGLNGCGDGNAVACVIPFFDAIDFTTPVFWP